MHGPLLTGQQLIPDQVSAVLDYELVHSIDEVQELIETCILKRGKLAWRCGDTCVIEQLRSHGGEEGGYLNAARRHGRVFGNRSPAFAAIRARPAHPIA